MRTWIIFFLFPLAGICQPQFSFDTPVVMFEGEQMDAAWSGGLNSPQPGTIDLNLDGKPDLVTFDRTSKRILTFLDQSSSYVYAPYYESLLPGPLEGWVLFRDYDCDGRKDIFAHTLFGIKVYRNTSTTSLSWELVADPLFTKGFSGDINLQVNVIDLPDIDDIDGDGDLDILVFDFGGSGSVEYHRNMSMEQNGTCDLLYERITEYWGNFTECACDDFAFQEPCNTQGRVQHVAGKSLLTIDVDNDQDKDLLVGMEDCETLYFLENEGTADSAAMHAFSSSFPDTNNPVSYFIYPATYFEDVTFDGVKDLLSAPNFFFNRHDAIDFERSMWLYRNDGSDQLPAFNFVRNDFLQGEMIDVGENAVPTTADFDGDGDQDLFVGSRGSGSPFAGGIWMFENVGSADSAAFQFVTNNYLDLRSLGLIEIKPQFIDLTADGRPDLVFAGSIGNRGSLYVLPNKSSGVFDFDKSEAITLNVELDADDNPHFTRINDDNLPDLLIARLSGSLDYYRNTGSSLDGAFELQKEGFYGIEEDFERKFLSATTGDIDGDQEPDLITTDQGRGIVFYTNFLASLNNPSPAEPLQITYDEGIAHTYFGNASYVTTGRLDSKSLPGVLIGTMMGGIHNLANAGGQVPGLPGEPLNIIVYPNPQVGSTNTIITIVINKPATVVLMNMVGQVVSPASSINAGSNRLELGTLQQGTYVLSIQSDAEQQARKIIIH